MTKRGMMVNTQEESQKELDDTLQIDEIALEDIERT